MKIRLKNPDSPYVTTIETDYNVTIEEAYIGPIFVNGDTCVSLFARDGGFEGFCWQGVPDHNEPLPEGTLSFGIGPKGYNTIEQVLIQLFIEQIVWMSAADAFGPGGPAHEGWVRFRDEVLKPAMDMYDQIPTEVEADVVPIFEEEI